MIQNNYYKTINWVTTGLENMENLEKSWKIEISLENWKSHGNLNLIWKKLNGQL